MAAYSIFLVVFPLKVISGPGSNALGKRLSEALLCSHVPIEWKLFPDGESYVRLKGKIKGEKVVLVQSTSPPQDKRLMELFFLLRLIEEYGAANIFLVVPYLAYMRQDKKFLSGEVVSARIVAELISNFNIDSLILINVHSELVPKYFKCKVFEVSAFPLLGDFLSNYDLQEPFILAPDAKALKFAEEVASKLNAEYDFLEKHRDLVSGKVKTLKKKLNVKGRDVVLVDDIISSGGTMVNAASILRELGARRILAACVHGLFIGNAISKMYLSGISEIISTDTVESYYSRVSVAPVIREAIEKFG
ncbi:MAG TPA: ribose-phosphate diphosphokinase [Candidatus Bathyarchaeota archaeon]|nr:ribose-phosphate diphosphokinase [Candidatus Bathyarchaeota archaeon]